MRSWLLLHNLPYKGTGAPLSILPAVSQEYLVALSRDFRLVGGFGYVYDKIVVQGMGNLPMPPS